MGNNLDAQYEAVFRQVMTASAEKDKQPDLWADIREARTKRAQYEQMVQHIRRQMEHEQELLERSRRRMSKADMLQGVLSELAQMRAKMDELTALVAAEILTQPAESTEQPHTAHAVPGSFSLSKLLTNARTTLTGAKS